MKHNFKKYAVCWAILFALFHAAVFFVRPILPGYVVRYDARFWVSWGLSLVAFAGNLICARIAFREENLQRFFYHSSLVTVSYTGVILMLLAGAACMLIPDCPAWIAAVVCLMILAFHAVAVIKASAAAEIVSGVDEKVKAQTQFMKLATVNAQKMMHRAKREAAKTACKKVYEALRYSDPMSSEALSVEEAKIAVKLDELASALNTDADNISQIAEELVLLVNERNDKCKALK